MSHTTGASSEGDLLGRGEPHPFGAEGCTATGGPCRAALAAAALQHGMGMEGWRPRPGWSCGRVETFLVLLSRMKPPGRPSLHGDAGASPRLVVRVPPGLRARAVRAAAVRGTSLSALVRAALERHVGALESEPPPVPAGPTPTAAVLLTRERSRARAREPEPFDAEQAYAEADAADAAARASGGPDLLGPIP